MFFDWTKDAIDTLATAPVQMQMQPDLLAAALEAKGVGSDKPVVVSSWTGTPTHQISTKYMSYHGERITC